MSTLKKGDTRKSMKKELSYLGQNKIFAHTDRINEWLRIGQTLPVTIEIDTSNACNHKCPGCVGGRTDNGNIPYSFLKDIINQISAHCRGLIFTGGGEPLCNKDTMKALVYARQKGIDIGFITNGGLLTKSISETLVKNCVWIRVSVDASNPDDYRKIHGMGEKEYHKVWKNIRELTRIRDTSCVDCTIGVAYLTRKDMIPGMQKFTELAKDSGVDYAQFRPFNFDKTNVLPEVAQCKKIESESFRVIASTHKYQLMKNGGWQRKYKECFGHHFATVIAADYKMYLCCHMRGNNKYCLGDLKKNSISEIWNSDKRKKVYESIDFKDCPPMCRCDTFNEILWQIHQLKKSGAHLNFL